MKIFTINNRKEEKFLRQKTAEFDFNKYTKKEIGALIKEMKKIMIENNGIGLSANQVGLNLRFFIVQIPKNISGNQPNNQAESAFYAIFNPEIIKFSEKKINNGRRLFKRTGYLWFSGTARKNHFSWLR